ncbi:MAG: C-GCAxxG-C-C family protein [Acetatifactor sp.]
MEIDIEKSPRAQQAMAYFKEGYNCSQAVFLTFADKYNMDKGMALKLSSSFGGGVGRLREVCGAVSGMCMVAGLLYGYDEPKDLEGKAEHYARIQELAGEFRERNGSIVCKELLGLTKKEDSPIPDKRTEEYYKKRPCVQLVGMAAAIMEQYLDEH